MELNKIFGILSIYVHYPQIVRQSNTVSTRLLLAKCTSVYCTEDDLLLKSCLKDVYLQMHPRCNLSNLF